MIRNYTFLPKFFISFTNNHNVQNFENECLLAEWLPSVKWVPFVANGCLLGCNYHLERHHTSSKMCDNPEMHHNVKYSVKKKVEC